MHVFIKIEENFKISDGILQKVLYTTTRCDKSSLLDI